MTNTLFDDILRIPMAQEPLHDLLSANVIRGGATRRHKRNYTIKRGARRRRGSTHHNHNRRLR